VQRTDTVPATYLPTILAAALDGAASVYEAYSEYEHKIRSFKDHESLLHYLGSKQKDDRRQIALAVYFNEAKGYVRTRRIQLIPEKCNGATWRETVEGWGLVHVQMTFLADRAVECRVAANSQERASGWASNNPDLRDPALWDWKVVDKHARRLIRVLRQGA
jgi:hypothetical protein